MLLLTSIEIVQWNYSLEPAGTIPFLQPVWNLGPTILGQGLQDTPANSRFPPPSVSRPGWKSSCHQCYPRVVCMERHPGHTTLEKGHQLVTIGQTDEEQETSILNGYNPKTTRDFSLLPNVPENRAMIGNFNRRDSIWEDRFSTITVAIGRTATRCRSNPAEWRGVRQIFKAQHLSHQYFLCLNLHRRAGRVVNAWWHSDIGSSAHKDHHPPDTDTSLPLVLRTILLTGSWLKEFLDADARRENPWTVQISWPGDWRSHCEHPYSCQEISHEKTMTGSTR